LLKGIRRVSATVSFDRKETPHPDGTEIRSAKGREFLIRMLNQMGNRSMERPPGIAARPKAVVREMKASILREGSTSAIARLRKESARTQYESKGEDHRQQRCDPRAF
jgi:hypothetical protein